MKVKTGLTKLILCISLIAGLFQTGYSQRADSIRVLFVGNSFTYFYNLPQVVSAMAKSQGVNIYTRQSTVGGSNLEQHWKGEKGTKTRDILKSGHWDYVVFNNHSLSSIDTPESFMEYGKKFADLVRQGGGKPVFMMTWAYKSNPLMQTKITEMHKQLAQEARADYVPAGHPSSNGTYLLGLAFYKYFSGKSTAKIPDRITCKDWQGEKLYLLFMPKEDANFLQQLVDEFTFEATNKMN